MNTKLLLSGLGAVAILVSVAYFAGDVFKGVQASPPTTLTHVFDHSKVDWTNASTETNSPSQSIGAADD